MTGVLTVRRLAELATPEGTSARAGAAQGAIRRVTSAALRFENGCIAFAGTDTEFVRRYGEAPLPGETILDGRGKTAVPGFVDAHTHLPWDGFREDEFNRLLKGETYAGIAASGGGIVATMNATRAASVETLAANVRGRLDRMLAHGTTFCEAKTGYGLDLPNEKKQLAAILAGAKGHAVGVAPTALPAHELPPERRGSDALRRRYVDECLNEILPALAEGGARFADVFCEEGVFSLAESAEILEAGRSLGLVPRVHADELTPLGGASLAARMKAASADHLLFATDEGIADMAAAGVVATLLPGTSVFLRMNRYAPARKMIAAGVAVALGTDCNPGSSYTESLPAVAFLASVGMGLTVEETLTAMTLNAASSLGEGARRGTLEEGKAGDAVLLDGPAVEHLVYHWGVSLVTDVIAGGRHVVQRGLLR
ncbi:MAG: imidazolonepropionase [Acidobacteria bacterium]|nr:imidazolonepropionase [Acidobacteriota bacterium]